MPPLVLGVPLDIVARFLPGPRATNPVEKRISWRRRQNCQPRGGFGSRGSRFVVVSISVVLGRIAPARGRGQRRHPGGRRGRCRRGWQHSGSWRRRWRRCRWGCLARKFRGIAHPEVSRQRITELVRTYVLVCLLVENNAVLYCTSNGSSEKERSEIAIEGILGVLTTDQTCGLVVSRRWMRCDVMWCNVVWMRIFK